MRLAELQTQDCNSLLQFAHDGRYRTIDLSTVGANTRAHSRNGEIPWGVSV
jgi:hypothetical protein